MHFITGTSTDGCADKVMFAAQLLNKATLEMCVKMRVAECCAEFVGLGSALNNLSCKFL